MTTLPGNSGCCFGADAAKASRIVILAEMRRKIEDIRMTKRNDATYTKEMKRGMEDALNGLLQDLLETT